MKLYKFAIQTSFDIVKENGGDLMVKSEEDEGTDLTMQLPNVGITDLGD